MVAIRSPADFQKHVQLRRKKRMDRIDAMPAELRELVHEYGFNVVDQFMSHGITKERTIRHLVECVLNEFSPTRGSYSMQGIRTEQVEAETP